MTAPPDTFLAAVPGFRSRDVARFAWLLEEQRRTLTAETRGLSTAELGWQPAPGLNSIGMLLAHVAYVEAHLVQVGILGEAVGHGRDVVGFGEEDIGMPLPQGAAPHPALTGRDLAFFDDALSRARAHTLRALEPLGDADLERVVERRRPDGTLRRFNLGWVLYHLLEHEAGHRGQVALLWHQHRVEHPGAA